ncbi:MAG: hypothetical protein K0S33_386 [Bacteroidetes bacterium]|jgi:uncharacterized membrane protein|nr:hypothetical protein [Bacteroidota bacterium]
MTSEEKIRLLAQKLALLSHNVDKQKSEIDLIREQINVLLSSLTDPKAIQEIKNITDAIKPAEQKTVIPEIKPVIKEEKQPEIIRKEEVTEKKEEPIVENVIVPEVKPVSTDSGIKKDPEVVLHQAYNPPPVQPKKVEKSFNFEQYLGGKLAGIIGIIALVIGLAMGVKYAIDNDLVNPLTRVLFGFVSGAILLTFAFILKKKYHLFSAIVLGGSVSILFFSAFAGHAFYELYPRGFAFVLMFIITAFTVFAAHSYNYEIIAVIGLVGAYAIPPLLSDGSGKIAYMFTYMAIINAGILVLSLFKNWTWVKYSAYGLTWLISASWVLSKYSPIDLNMCMAFLTIFFLTFYITFIGYKVIRKIPFQAIDIVTLMSNSLIYFGLGYYVLNNQFTEMYLGLFCVFNAVIHMAVAWITWSRKVTDKNILYFILALVFTYITIAIPVQLEGSKVTLCWFAEMLALFFIGSRFNVLFFRQIAYAVSALGFVSLWHDWLTYYPDLFDTYSKPEPTGLFNKMFITALFASIALGVFLFFLHRKNAANEDLEKKDALLPLMRVFGAVIFLTTVYFTFFFEIIHYFRSWETSTAIKNGSEDLYYSTRDKSISLFLAEWLLIYNAVFASLCFFINSISLRSKALHWTFYALSILSLVILIPGGLAALGELRSYFNSTSDEYFPSQFRSAWMINFRYVFMLISAAVIFLVYFTQRGPEHRMGRNVYVWFMHLAILTLLSSELVNQFRLMHPEDAVIYDKIARRMGFTILWALYSMLLIVLGIARKVKQLRIMGLVLFGAALIKLLADSLNMSGGYKIIVWISIGAILTIIGFLYQRYKTVMFGDDEENK